MDISCSNDVMNHVDCVIKRDVYPQKIHSCSKNICGISFFVLKIYQEKYIIGVIAWVFRWLKDECRYIYTKKYVGREKEASDKIGR